MIRRVIGLDLSLSRTGLASNDGDPIFTCTFANPTGPTIEQRIATLSHQALTEVRWRHGPVELVVVEGLPSARLSGAGSSVASLGMLHGVIRHYLAITHGFPLLVVEPASIKKYATGKGNANKDLVRDAARDRFGLAAGTTSDECDAAWACAIGCALLGTPLVEVPKLHQTALETLSLPPELRTEETPA
jgi:Holliday junction resolvasome RuvABC endonuclease subunit